MTPPMATHERSKRTYRRREVIAKRCPECESRKTGVNGYDRDAGGNLRSEARYCKCFACGATWKQWPAG
jgi:hypothetical protein